MYFQLAKKNTEETLGYNNAVCSVSLVNDLNYDHVDKSHDKHSMINPSFHPLES